MIRSTFVRALVVLGLALSVAYGKAKKSVTKRDTLVILDSLTYRSTHSTYFERLEKAGHSLVFRMAKDPELEIEKYDEFLYDNIIILAPEADTLGGDVDVDRVVNFIDSGRNVFIAGSPRLGDVVRDLAVEVSIDADERGTSVIDHAHYVTDETLNPSNKHTLVLAGDVAAPPVVLGDAHGSKVLYEGVSLAPSAKNELVFCVLRGSVESFSYRPDDRVTDLPHTVGHETCLIAAMQTRNNARVVVSGSVSMLSNAFFEASARHGANNEDFSVEVTEWATKGHGLLRARDISHHRVGESVAPKMYTVNDEVEFSLVLEELRDGEWHAYSSKNIQFEMQMLDPWWRVNLEPDTSVAGRHAIQLKCPDVYGVYTFRVDYRPRGYTNVLIELTQPIRPYRHDQYERFLLPAYPYYSATFTILGGIVVFSAFFLFSKD